MLRHLWAFVVAVLRSWGVLTTGGFVVALIGLWEHLSARPIAGWPLWIAVALSLVSACFSAWRKERLTVESFSQQRREELEAAAKSKQRREVKRQLTSFLLDLEDRIEALKKMDANAVIMFEITPSDREKDNKLIDDIFHYITENVELSDAGGLLSSVGLPRAYNSPSEALQSARQD
jgi:hypothetical protein